MTIKALEEMTRVESPFRADARSSAETRYNDQVTASCATGIDTKGYDEALIALDVNAIAGGGTLDVTVLEDDAKSSAVNATAISGAVFTQKTSSDDAKTFVGRIKTKLTQRYLYVKAVQGVAASKKYSVHVLLGRARDLPVSQEQTVEFTV